MFDNLNRVPREYSRDLDVRVVRAAVAGGFIRSPYHPDAETVKHIQDYFHHNLTPAEAAEACFVRKH